MIFCDSERKQDDGDYNEFPIAFPFSFSVVRRYLVVITLKRAEHVFQRVFVRLLRYREIESLLK